MSPTYPLWSKIGCPEAFDTTLETPYSGGDTVESDGKVYECKPAFSVRCNQDGWQPGSSLYWAEAWVILGSCSGTIAPSSSPTKSPSNSPSLSPTYALWSKIGCPPEYSGPGDATYGEGDEVSLNGLVYECKPYPDSGYCNLYSPDSVNGSLGSLGWTTLGSCTGTSKLYFTFWKRLPYFHFATT